MQHGLRMLKIWYLMMTKKRLLERMEFYEAVEMIKKGKTPRWISSYFRITRPSLVKSLKHFSGLKGKKWHEIDGK